MSVSRDAFQRFQDELAALERIKEPVLTPDQLRLIAKTEFLDLTKKYNLTVADVLAFFPEEEGIAYLQELIVANEAKAARKRKV